MRIVDRSLICVRELSVVEHEELRLFVLGKAGPPPLLSRVREKGFWFACDCRQPNPVMHVARRDDGVVSLKNNPEGFDHAPGCSFMRSPTDSANRRQASSRFSGRIVAGSHVALHSEFQANSKGLPSQISRSATPVSSQKNVLLSMLLTLIEIAELGVYCPARPVLLSQQFAAIRHAASRFTIHPGIPLEHVLDTRITKARLVALAKKLRELGGFGKSRRCGLLLDVIKSAGPRHLALEDGSEISFFGNAEALHGKSPPMLTLATVTTQDADSAFYQLGKVAFVPVLSANQLFPVVDDPDREVVAEIFGLLRWLHTKKDIQVTAFRDVFQEGSGHGLSLRSKGQLLEIDLNPSIIDGLSPRETTLSLSELGSLDALKKRIAGVLIKGVFGE
ncbi:hypothetical protein [Stutzerimonas stutzeri]|uniref:hypothetical protein n=1 Tax=Stutzerimonas stutzeri TaxID=316 RepID=UPI00265CED7A|nr:hypothetical protein [Stutzerimonas stutzeri]MCF6783705.1 DUF1173 domain-containing protein [Stutzerimonas stutzeri]